jgi:hypothetical protein
MRRRWSAACRQCHRQAQRLATPFTGCSCWPSRAMGRPLRLLLGAAAGNGQPPPRQPTYVPAECVVVRVIVGHDRYRCGAKLSTPRLQVLLLRRARLRPPRPSAPSTPFRPGPFGCSLSSRKALEPTVRTCSTHRMQWDTAAVSQPLSGRLLSVSFPYAAMTSLTSCRAAHRRTLFACRPSRWRTRRSSRPRPRRPRAWSARTTRSRARRAWRCLLW